MARVLVTEVARADLRAMILTQSLPDSTVERVRAAAAPLADFPQLGPALEGNWQGLRFLLGPWPECSWYTSGTRLPTRSRS